MGEAACGFADPQFPLSAGVPGIEGRTLQGSIVGGWIGKGCPGGPVVFWNGAVWFLGWGSLNGVHLPSPSRLRERRGALHPPVPTGPLLRGRGALLQRGDHPGAGTPAQGENREEARRRGEAHFSDPSPESCYFWLGVEGPCFLLGREDSTAFSAHLPRALLAASISE